MPTPQFHDELNKKLHLLIDELIDRRMTLVSRQADIPQQHFQDQTILAVARIFTAMTAPIDGEMIPLSIIRVCGSIALALVMARDPDASEDQMWIGSLADPLADDLPFIRRAYTAWLPGYQEEVEMAEPAVSEVETEPKSCFEPMSDVDRQFAIRVTNMADEVYGRPMGVDGMLKRAGIFMTVASSMIVTVPHRSTRDGMVQQLTRGLGQIVEASAAHRFLVDPQYRQAVTESRALHNWGQNFVDDLQETQRRIMEIRDAFSLPGVAHALNDAMGPNNTPEAVRTALAQQSIKDLLRQRKIEQLPNGQYRVTGDLA